MHSQKRRLWEGIERTSKRANKSYTEGDRKKRGRRDEAGGEWRGELMPQFRGESLPEGLRLPLGLEDTARIWGELISRL